MTILDEIFAHKRQEVARSQLEKPLASLQEQVEQLTAGLDFVAALQSASHQPALIAEVKRASPSRGLLLPDFDPLTLAETYRRNGAAAVSVLTDERYFQGSLAYLAQISSLFSGQAASLPLLRKDFLFDPYQVYEARLAGADAVLLIAAMLTPQQFRELHGLSLELGMTPLVEVHTQAELDLILPFKPVLVGINNRDLHDFSVSLATTERLRPHIPPGVCVVAESGIHSAADVARLKQVGVDAILVGEALVTAPDVGAAVGELSGQAVEA